MSCVARAAALHLDLIEEIIKYKASHVFHRIGHVSGTGPLRSSALAASALLCSACYMAFSEHNFSGALATWKGVCVLFSISARELTCSVLSEINLSELQKTLDSQGLEVVENQKESVVGRKALADKTKGKLSIICASKHVVPISGQTSRRYPMRRRSTRSRAC